MDTGAASYLLDVLYCWNNTVIAEASKESCCIIQESAVASASLLFNVNAPSIPMISGLESHLHIVWIATSFCCFSFLLLVPHTQQTRNKQSWNFHWALFTEQISCTVFLLPVLEDAIIHNTVTVVGPKCNQLSRKHSRLVLHSRSKMTKQIWSKCSQQTTSDQSSPNTWQE